jgi:molecular chaperone GrpE
MSEPTPTQTPEAAGEPRTPRPEPPADEQLAALRRERDELERRYLYLRADFDNTLKRTRHEIDTATQLNTADILKGVVNVLDDLDRAVAAAGTVGDAGGPLAAGVKAVISKFHALLAKYGAEPIESVGKPFDPAFHEAIAFEETDTVPDATVTAEFSRGYKLGNRSLRAARVKVSRAPEEAAVAADGNP